MIFILFGPTTLHVTLMEPQNVLLIKQIWRSIFDS